MKNVQLIRNAVETILVPHDAAWQDSFVAFFVATAEKQFAEWSAFLNAPLLSRSHDRSEPRYISYAKANEYEQKPWGHQERQAALAAGKYSVNTALAIRDGKDAYNETREAFIVRVVSKIEYVCQGVDLSAATFQGEASFARRIEGYLNVTLGATTFRVTLEVKTNYRYGDNSANGVLTTYSQYPVHFVYAVVNGEQLSVLGEEILANKISGLPVDHKERTERAVIDAKKAGRAEKNALKDRKDAFNNIAGEYSSIEYWQSCKGKPGSNDAHLDTICGEAKAKITAICAKHGITDPGSKKAASKEAKAVLAAIRLIGNLK